MIQNTFPDKETIAVLTAKMLLEIGTVHFRDEVECLSNQPPQWSLDHDGRY